MARPTSLCTFSNGMCCREKARERERIKDSALQASAEILFLKGQFSDSGEQSSTSGRTGHVEYCRTFGALIATCVHSAALRADAGIDQVQRVKFVHGVQHDEGEVSRKRGNLKSTNCGFVTKLMHLHTSVHFHLAFIM